MHLAPRSRRRRLPAALAATALAAAAALGVPAGAVAAPAGHGPARTASPIRHIVVLFDENISFDHYFGTYPKAANTDGTRFTAGPGTPAPVNLLSHGGRLLTHNPNQYQPHRLSPSQALTCDQNHSYTPEQKAYHDGAMDRFVQNTGNDRCSGQYGSPGLTMDYFDGNTVTALWNYAQNYALSDNSFDDVFGPSTPGALDLVSGNTHGGVTVDSTTGRQLPPDASNTVGSPDPVTGVGTVHADSDPAYDDCSDGNHTATDHLTAMKGRTIGDLLDARGVSWGWFQGGFAPTSRGAGGAAVCGATHANIGGAASVDYSPHHEPFQYYRSTANPHHLPPTSTAMIGHQDRANHQYDLADFDRALAAGALPAVSYLKAASYQDGHAGYSDPLDEQDFLTTHINAIEKSAQWPSTAIVVAYDDSDGWYDQVMAPIGNGSTDAGADTAMCRRGPAAAGGYLDRCGPGPRLPLLVISPYARAGRVDHTRTGQSSVLRFIEDNWGTGRIGDASFDADAGSLAGMFDFARPQQRAVLLAADGSVAATVPVRVPPGRMTVPGTAAPTGRAPADAAAPMEGAAEGAVDAAADAAKNGSAQGSALPDRRPAVRSSAGDGPALSAARLAAVSVPGALLVAGAGAWVLRRTGRLGRFNR
ncbi:alkaline phosphatase family protein [Streptomyces sp. V4-01]|uniref:phospholipase C n=1 Tax=Actinacidiphila polyblastidii TaxID=3110430 RepID=A0ABU7P5W7_9ACTN|nr:alkaline phosphatase family protein [Streptomyces sp. V4-01]